VLADVQGPEAAAIHAPIYAEKLYQPDVRERLRLAREVPGWRHVAALARMREITQEVRQALAPYDAVVLPTVLIPPPPLEEDPSAVREPLLRNTRLASLTGLPAVSVPVTETGVQLVGVDYARVMAAAAWVENTVHTPL
ncbi:MAG: amidase, partial [Nonomuraea sp.]|nr:amidase [Nonomuraea sp.]